MKIYIVGAVASGKSTLANALSDKLNIPYHSLDEIVHIPDNLYPSGNRKREVEERDKIFQSLIEQSNWIIEDVGRPCFGEGLKNADFIILLDFPTRYRVYRILKRWIKQRMGVEKCIYKPKFVMLKCMLRWSRDYDTGKDKLKERVMSYKDKVVILENKNDLNKYLEIISKNNLTQID